MTLLSTHALLTTATAYVSNITLLPLSTGAKSLDGSPYGFYFVPYHGDVDAHKTRWTISIAGGGWCVGVDDCYARSQQKTHDGEPGSLGSSTPWIGHAHGCSCMNTNQTDVETASCNCIEMLYLDGGSFSGNVEDPVAVPSKPGKFVHYRGIHNLDATLDYAFAKLGMADATELVVTGGSAGGLSTFLHTDRIAARVRKGVKDPSKLLITAAPVVGYFLDHATYQEAHPVSAKARASDDDSGYSYPHSGNYSSWMRTVFSEQNVSSSLNSECLTDFTDNPHLCYMSPHMVTYVETPLFMFNSKFDAWQMDNDLQVPCKAGDAGHVTCNSTESAAIVQYGADFLTALQPVIASQARNGAFITSCICHGCPWSTVKTGASGDVKTSYGHYAAWHTKMKTKALGKGQEVRVSSSEPPSIHIDTRGPNGDGAITDPLCMAFP